MGVNFLDCFDLYALPNDMVHHIPAYRGWQDLTMLAVKTVFHMMKTPEDCKCVNLTVVGSFEGFTLKAHACSGRVLPYKKPAARKRQPVGNNQSTPPDILWFQCRKCALLQKSINNLLYNRKLSETRGVMVKFIWGQAILESSSVTTSFGHYLDKIIHDSARSNYHPDRLPSQSTVVYTCLQCCTHSMTHF